MAIGVSWSDIRYCATNNNRKVVIAASATFAETSQAVYFLTRIEGSNTTIKDAAGNTILIVNSNQSWEPGEFRVDGGIGIDNGSGTTNEAYFFTVPARV